MLWGPSVCVPNDVSPTGIFLLESTHVIAFAVFHVYNELQAEPLD